MKVYKYLAKPPITDYSAIDRQLRLAVDYQRVLVEIEVRRRQAVEKLYADALPVEYARCVAVERDVETAILALRAARSDQVVRAPKGDEDAREDVKVAKAALVALRDEQGAARDARRVARKALTPTIKPSLQTLDEVARAERKAAYNDPTFADLAWGTKLAIGESVERAAKASAKEGTLPKMPTFDGSGAVVVQLQGGLPTSDVAGDTRFRLEAVDAATWRARCQEGRRRRVEAQRAEGFVRSVKAGDGILGNDGRPLPLPRNGSARSCRAGGDGQYALAHVRIGSEGRAPVWATWPVRISRPLPLGGVIKWARAQAHKVGTRVEWTIQVTVDGPEVAQQRVDGPILAVNFGWRNLEDGGVRVAYAVGSDGREEEVRVPVRFLEKITHVEHLRSVRDRLCDQAHAVLRAFIDDPDRETPLPEWLVEATRWVLNWRGPKQIARLVRAWESRRFSGDERVFVALATWRNGKDAQGHSVGNHHLRFWESDEREKAYLHRNEVYRQVARRWARDYARVIATDMDLRDFAEVPEPEEGARTDGARQRRTRTLAGPSILRGEIKRAFLVTGKEFEEKKGSWTQTCAACGAVMRFDAVHLLVRACGACGKVDDQDANHGRCLLASAQVARDRGGPLAPLVSAEEDTTLSKRSGRWARRRSRTAAQVVQKVDGNQ